MAKRATGRGGLPWADRRGVAALEFALMAPFLIFSMFGFIELARALRAAQMVNSASGAVAHMVGQMTTVVGGSSRTLGDFCQGAGLLTGRFNPGTGTAPLSLSIANVTAIGKSGPNDTAFTATLMWESDTACAGATAPSAKDALTAKAAPLLVRTGDSVVVVQANYRYVPFVSPPMFTFLTTTLSRTAYAPALFGSIRCTDSSGNKTEPSC